MKNNRVDRNLTRSFTSFAKRSSLGLAAAGALFTLTGTASAQLLYSQNFETDDSANWVVRADSLGASHIVNFNFDYSTIGIPKAPNSAPADGTHGLQLICNVNPLTQLGSSVVVGESTSPTNFSISQNFDMHVDMWANYNGPNVGPGGANVTKGGSATNAYTTVTGYTSATGGSGSTILYGCGYGTTGTSPQIAGSADSVFVGVTGDDGSAAEIRMYAPNKSSSYQDGTYQISGTATPDPGGDFFVYNNSTGSRNFRQISNTSAPGWTNHFWAVQPPQAQINNWLQQSNIVCRPGTTGFRWHDVEVQKIGNVIVYSIDGFIAGSANTASAGNPVGTYLTFLASDINGNASVDPNWTNLNFVVFDNIRVFNYANVVQVSASQPNASEAGTTGTFTITRTSAGVPLTVNYTMGGTATNGVNYQTLSGSVTFNNTDLSTNVTLTPIDDGVPETTMGAILSITPSVNYVGAGNATVSIADNDTPTLDITCTRVQAYDRYDLSTLNPDFILYHLTRRGQLSPALTANLGYSGTAVSGTDYIPSNSIAIAGGAQGVDFAVYPKRNTAVTGNQTVTITVNPGGGYAIGNGQATGTIVDSDYASAPVLLSDALIDPNDATNWSITYGTGDPTNSSVNFNVDFGFNLSSAYGAPVPPPPGGAGFGLHETCNKNVSPGAAGAVNAYYTNLLLSGNYAVRFNMNLIEGETVASATEGAVFGINHTGSQSNWWWGSGTIAPYTWGSDGIWYFVSAQALGNIQGDYQEFTGLGGTNGNAGWTRLAAQATTPFTDAFKDTPGPFTTIDDSSGFSSGTPANAPPIAYDASTWSDVEIKQINNVITLSINKTSIFAYTNTTVWTSGYLMLGYSDPYGGSVGSPDASVYYANLQVVQLPATVTINSIAISAGNVVVTFTTSNPSDTTSSFTLQSSGTVGGTYSNVSPAANISSLGSNQFQATTPYHGGTQFYRIHHN
jgi:hypothetical protein